MNEVSLSQVTIIAFCTVLPCNPNCYFGILVSVLMCGCFVLRFIPVWFSPATLLVLFVVSVPGGSLAIGFSDAQVAATEGRYDEVVSILTAVIEKGELEGEAKVIAFSNRGVAYSLLKKYPQGKRDLLQAIELDPDHQLTINHLGIMAQHVDADYRAAAVWYRRAAATGYPASQTNLAMLYKEGLGVEKDSKKAFSLYEMAAAEEYVMAYVPLGELYMQGIGVNKDYGAGLIWINKGAKAGVISAHYHLGLAYENGRGVAPSARQAADEYYRAAMQGHGKAQNALGYLYQRGNGVPQDYIKAVEWYQLASDQGVMQATNRLAWLLATCPTERVCNGALALQLAKSAVDDERTPTNLDSLAAAYARSGDYETAITTVKEIIQMGSQRYASRLDLYQQGKPFQL